MSGHDDHADCGCREYNELSRRNFILKTAGAAVFAGAVPDWVPRVVMADSASGARDVIVNIFQRGGADGLSLCAPFADPNYYTARPTLAIPRPDSGSANKGTALDNYWMFPKAMTGLLPAFQGGELLVVHGAGLTFSSRSHFDAQHFIEVGSATDDTVSTGWLGRHLATSWPVRPSAPLRALAIANGLPLTLGGAPLTIPMPSPPTFAIGGSGSTQAARSAWLANEDFLAQEPPRPAALPLP